MRCKVVRLYADNKWHVEGKGLSKTKAFNLKNRLLKSVNHTSPDNIRIINEEDIFDVIIRETEHLTGGTQ